MESFFYQDSTYPKVSDHRLESEVLEQVDDTAYFYA
jgi:hypothetical protein